MRFHHKTESLNALVQFFRFYPWSERSDLLVYRIKFIAVIIM